MTAQKSQSPPPPSVCLLMPRVVSKTKAAQKKQNVDTVLGGKKACRLPKYVCCLKAGLLSTSERRGEKEEIERLRE